MKRLVIAAVIVVGLLGVPVGVALAHHPVVAGQASCGESGWSVQWTASADAVRGKEWKLTAPVATAWIADNLTHVFTVSYPFSQSSAVQSVTASWRPDGPLDQTRTSDTVNRPTGCNGTTTTTSTVAPTTTIQETTTSTVAPTTTTLETTTSTTTPSTSAPSTSSTPPTTAAPTTVPTPDTVPETSASSVPPSTGGTSTVPMAPPTPWTSPPQTSTPSSLPPTVAVDVPPVPPTVGTHLPSTGNGPLGWWAFEALGIGALLVIGTTRRRVGT